MALHLILGSIVFVGGLFTVGLLLVVVGIRRGERGKRLTGRPADRVEAFTRRLLTGSRGCEVPGDGGERR